MPNFDIGIGSKVAIGRGETPTWTDLVGIQDVTMPNRQTEEVEVTHMGSLNRTREFISGLNDNGTVSLEMNWEPDSATDVALEACHASGELIQIRFTIVGAAAPKTFAGFVQGYETVAPVGEKLTATVTFRINGPVA